MSAIENMVVQISPQGPPRPPKPIWYAKKHVSAMDCNRYGSAIASPKVPASRR